VAQEPLHASRISDERHHAYALACARPLGSTLEKKTLVVEVDGAQHARQRGSDRRRDVRLAQLARDARAASGSRPGAASQSIPSYRPP
jgi:hypothetical protein